MTAPAPASSAARRAWLGLRRLGARGAICALPLILSSLAHAAADGAWRVITPAERKGHATVFDPVRDRMLVIGGRSVASDPVVYYDDVWELTLGGTPMWRHLAPDGPGPSARAGHTAVYDPVADRVIIFGGTPGLSDTWELRLSPALEWNQLSFDEGDPVPHGRSDHAAVYDSHEQRMIVMGGNDFLTGRETWALSLSGIPAWTLLAIGDPGNRTNHTMIYDANDDRVILHSGDAPDDVWELSLVGAPTWTELFPSGTSPGARSDHTAIYDAVRDRMLVYGGEGLGVCDAGPGPIGGQPATQEGAVSVDCTHVWELTLAGGDVEWTELTPGGNHPGSRSGHSAIYDPPRERMILYSGPELDDLDYRDIAALYLSAPETWGDLSPRARLGFAAVYDLGMDGLIGFGGASDGAVRNDLWALSGNGETHGWTQLTPTGIPPSARSDAAAAHDAVRHRLIIMGGTNGTSDLGDVWSVDLDDPMGLVWTPVTPTGSPPTARSGHTADYDPSHDRVIVFGGHSGAMALGDVWTLSLDGMVPSWTSLTTTGAPPPRFGHAALYDPVLDALMVFGGTDGPNYFNDTWGLFFGGQLPTWAMMPTPSTLPAARHGHGMIRDPVRDRLVIFGGTVGTSVVGDLWSLTLSGIPSWEPLTPFGPFPLPRSDHAMVYDAQSDRVLIFGGADETGSFSDAYSIAWGGIVAVQDRTPPIRAGLLRVAPNPTSGATRVIIESARTEPVRLAIYDVRGRLVRDVLAANMPAGEHSLEWDGRDRRGEPVPGGVYFGRVMIGNRRFEAKIIVFR